MRLNAAQLAVRAILEDENREWTTQGLGMLRTYLPDNCRLHIWNPELKYQDVSELHTHPWNMNSHVISGAVQNTIYLVNPSPNANYMQQKIRCGEGGGVEGDPEPVQLTVDFVSSRIIPAGSSYSQSFDEVHRSTPRAGTVTIIERSVPFGGSPDFANVYFPVREEWVSAEPRAAKPEEVESSVKLALAEMGVG